MLPILSTAQLRRLENIAMKRDDLTALHLMEVAGTACAERIGQLVRSATFGPGDSVVVLAGMGNNGGDGLVVARRLHQAGIQVRVMRVVHRDGPSPENAENHQRLLEIGLSIIDIDHSNYGIYVYDNVIIIDSIFGSGLTRSPDGWVAHLIAMINASGCPVVSIDLPSGLIAPDEGKPFDPAACIRADRTLTFEAPRLGLLLPETGEFAGRFELLPIGLDAGALVGKDRVGNWVGAMDIAERLGPRPLFGHKGTFGHCLIAAGSRGMYGAAVLALKGCLRSGVGLVTGHSSGEMVTGMMTVAPDAMCSIDPNADHMSVLPALDRFNAVAIGPGCGQHPDTAAVVQQCLRSVQVPLVLDADALNLLAQNPGWLDLLGPRTVLTPHPKEMDRLLGSPSTSSYERLRRTQAFAQRYGCTIVLKGAYSVTCTPDGALYFNSSGNAGMAKGGSGDVLTGLLAGLLAQGYSVQNACLIGVYLHGSAGDISAQELGMDAMRPSDLIDALPKGWKQLRSASKKAVQ